VTSWSGLAKVLAMPIWIWYWSAAATELQVRTGRLLLVSVPSGGDTSVGAVRQGGVVALAVLE